MSCLPSNDGCQEPRGVATERVLFHVDTLPLSHTMKCESGWLRQALSPNGSGLSNAITGLWTVGNERFKMRSRRVTRKQSPTQNFKSITQTFGGSSKMSNVSNNLQKSCRSKDRESLFPPINILTLINPKQPTRDGHCMNCEQNSLVVSMSRDSRLMRRRQRWRKHESRHHPRRQRLHLRLALCLSQSPQHPETRHAW